MAHSAASSRQGLLAPRRCAGRVDRWVWPSRHAVAMAALMDEAALPMAAACRRSPLRALEQQLLVVSETLASRQGRNVTAMIAAADRTPKWPRPFRHHFVLARRNEGRPLLQQAVESGELRADLQLDMALDQVYGAMLFRLLIGHAALDAAFVRALLKQAVGGFALRGLGGT